MSDQRQHLDSTFAGDSLVAKSVVTATEGTPRQLLPGVWMVLVSGSLMDRGAEVLLPLTERLAELSKRHKIVICAGSGVRERHTFKIGLDLGIPRGGLAMIAGAIPEQNAMMLWSLLCKDGAVRLAKENIGVLPMALELGQIPILVSQPPYHYWEYPDGDSALPSHGADCGAALLAENFGCRCLLLKDVGGIYDSDPYDNPDAKLIARASAGELLANGPKTLPVERALLDLMQHARRLKTLTVASGIDLDAITRILDGEELGTTIEAGHADRRLLSDAALNALPRPRRHRILPEVTVLKVGGQSVMDRGAAAVMPVVEQIKKMRDKVPMIIATGAGTRARHAYQIGLDLNLPPGVLATVGGSVARQNARMLQMLLSSCGSVLVPPEHFEQLPAFLAAGQLPVMSGMPPYEMWMRPPAVGQIPEARTDTGVFLLAETIGAGRLIFVKDEDTLYDSDPKQNPEAKPVATGDVAELKKLDLSDLLFERILLDMMPVAQFVRELTIVNAMVDGQLTAALEGEKVGARIYASGEPPK